MKAYRVVKRNRMENSIEEVIRINREKAEKEVAEIINKYNDAKAKGDGIHWAEVIYKDAWIEEIDIED